MRFVRYRFKRLLFSLIIVVLIFVFYESKDKIENLVSSQKTGTSKRATVAKNIDGDTLAIETATGETVSVRLIGIDTPETKRPGVSVECGGPQASESLKQLAPVGTEVKLVSDPTQDSTDRYNRALGYLYIIGDKESLNEKQVARGWAEVYVFNNKPFQKHKDFEKAAEKAAENNRGVYKLCQGDFHSSQ